MNLATKFLEFMNARLLPFENNEMFLESFRKNRRTWKLGYYGILLPGTLMLLFSMLDPVFAHLAGRSEIATINSVEQLYRSTLNPDVQIYFEYPGGWFESEGQGIMRVYKGQYLEKIEDQDLIVKISPLSGLAYWAEGGILSFLRSAYLALPFLLWGCLLYRKGRKLEGDLKT